MPVFPDIILPLWILLIPYALFAIFFAIWSLFNIYHLLRFGVLGYGLSLLMVIYLGGTAAIIFFSSALILQYDWMASVNVTDFIFSDVGPSIFPPL